jgi:protocatechuate 3,4-dioxygenase beta subunit
MDRRRLLQGTLAAGGLGLACPTLATAQSALPTPECRDGDEPTVRQGDGPYFKPNSPERFDLVERGTRERTVEISGVVLTRGCRPVERALLDLWHADEFGEYDNKGFRYRGHLFTDREGRYRFRTIVPALYPGRTRHYHVRVQAPDRRELVMRTAEAGDGLAARFDFVLDMR